MYIWYLIAFAVFVVIEASTYNLVTVWLAISSLAAGIYAYYFPDQVIVQLFLFLVLSVILIILTKPLVKKLKSTTEKTNADRLIGCEGIVLEEINQINGTGQVKVMGQIWSARAEDGSVIPKDTLVKIMKIEGVKLIVA